MKDIFDVSRFFAFFRKDFYENLRFNLIFLALMGMMILLVVTKFNPFLIEYSYIPTERDKLQFIAHYKEIYAQLFWGGVILFSGLYALRSFRGMRSVSKALTGLMLPVSNFEKYLLVFLQSTVMVFVAFFLLFYGITAVTNSYKYVGLNKLNYVEGGWFGNQLPALEPGQEVVHAEIGNVFHLITSEKRKVNHRYNSFTEKEKMVEGLGRDEENYISVLAYGWNIVLIFWLSIVSMFMWGGITFRRNPFLLTLLSHFLVMLILTILGCLILRFLILRVQAQSSVLEGGEFYGAPEHFWMLSWNWIYLAWIIPIVYQWVIWCKLKNKQLA